MTNTASQPKPGRGGFPDNMGGARKGAGRKKGAATVRTRAIADAAIKDGGLTPLEFMLRILREEPGGRWSVKRRVAHEAMRFEAAKAAAPYMHPRLAAVEHSGKDGGAIQFQRIVRRIIDPK